jgi:hypothetical protein
VQVIQIAHADGELGQVQHRLLESAHAGGAYHARVCAAASGRIAQDDRRRMLRQTARKAAAVPHHQPAGPADALSAQRVCPGSRLPAIVDRAPLLLGRKRLS